MKTSRGGMAEDVGNAFLRTSIQGDLHAVRRLGGQRRDFHQRLAAGGEPCLRDQTPERSLDGELLPVRRMQPMRYGAHLPERGLSQLAHAQQRIPRFHGEAATAAFEKIQIQGHSGERLPCPGVKFARDAAPLALEFLNHSFASGSSFCGTPDDCAEAIVSQRDACEHFGPGSAVAVGDAVEWLNQPEEPLNKL